MERISAWQELPGDLSGPLYEQIAEYVRRAVRRGVFCEGQKMPSKRSLAESLGLSLTTINAAYDLLTAEGYLLSYPRSCYRIGPLAELYFHMPPAETRTDSEESVPSLSSGSANAAGRDTFRYDLGLSGVDESLFREKQVKRIYKKIIDEGALSAEPEARGLLSLRSELAANLFSAQGILVRPENIIISYGTMGLFRFLFELLPNQTVYGIEDPGFKALELSLKRSGRRFCLLPVGPEGIAPEDLEQNDVTAACLTPNHQFPSGIEYSVPNRRKLLKWAYAAEDRYLIEDDYDGMIRHRSGGESLKKLDAKAERVLYLGSFSRSWSPGLRISYVCLPDGLSRRALRIGIPNSNPVPLTEQMFLAELIRSGAFERHLNRARRLYRRKRRLLLQELRQSDLPWDVKSGPAGLHLTAEIREPSLSASRFSCAAAEAGIKIECMDDYSFESSRPRELIIGFGRIPEDDIKPAVEALGRLWGRLYG